MDGLTVRAEPPQLPLGPPFPAEVVYPDGSRERVFVQEKVVAVARRVADGRKRPRVREACSGERP